MNDDELEEIVETESERPAYYEVRTNVYDIRTGIPFTPMDLWIKWKVDWA